MAVTSAAGHHRKLMPPPAQGGFRPPALSPRGRALCLSGLLLLRGEHLPGALATVLLPSVPVPAPGVPRSVPWPCCSQCLPPGKVQPASRAAAERAAKMLIATLPKPSLQASGRPPGPGEWLVWGGGSPVPGTAAAPPPPWLLLQAQGPVGPRPGDSGQGTGGTCPECHVWGISCLWDSCRHSGPGNCSPTIC